MVPSFQPVRKKCLETSGDPCRQASCHRWFQFIIYHKLLWYICRMTCHPAVYDKFRVKEDAVFVLRRDSLRTEWNHMWAWLWFNNLFNSAFHLFLELSAFQLDTSVTGHLGNHAQPDGTWWHPHWGTRLGRGVTERSLIRSLTTNFNKYLDKLVDERVFILTNCVYRGKPSYTSLSRNRCGGTFLLEI